MKKIKAVALLLFLTLCCYAQSDSLQARLILIGDAGDFKQGRHPVIDAVKLTTKIDKKTTVLFLGDNLYSTGLPDEQYSIYDIRRSVLDTQIAIANGTEGRVILIPGNHDWDRGKADGWDAIRRQQQYIDARGGKNVAFYPKDGCGGPVEVALSNDATLVIFDSQWWIHPHDKPGVESDCPYKTKSEILGQIEDILSRNAKKLVILACHHPFKSYGIHGGYYTLKQHIFPLTDLKPHLYIPLPVIGSIYPVARGVFGTPQDLKHPAYANMITDIQKIAKTHPNLIFVSGHEHNLELIKDSSFNYIISGSGTKSTRVSASKKAPFVSRINGYAVLDISKQKKATVTFFTVSDSIRKAYTSTLLDFSKLPPPKPEDSIPAVFVPRGADSVVTVANANYNKASKLKRFLNGNNYRDIWATPVKLKVFRIKEEMGGFKVTAIGGGHQTKSLKLADTSGKEWSLRTVNKDITKILPPGVQGSAEEDYLQDFISSAHPYSPLIIPPLAKAVDVTVATPRFFLVPNDPALGLYRPYFANTICMLEEKEPVPKGTETKSEQKIVNKLLDDNDDRIDQKAFLRARLLDFLVADWDRHFDQWRFGEKDTGNGKLYYPIPRDRDQAFSYANGLLVKLASGNFVPFLKGFRKNIPGINWLAYWARDLDRSFLNRLDSATWNRTTAAFKASLPDAVVDNAVQKLPPEIYAADGSLLAQKLKSRRDLLPAAAMKYYRFLSRRVSIPGSNKDEYFKVESAGKNLKVRVYEITEKTDSASLIYERVFEPSVTKEIDLYGLNGNDVFEVDKAAKSKIRLRIIGGRGQDTFNVKGKVKNYLYDFIGDTNYVQSVSRSRKLFENTPEVNRFSTTGFNYNRLYFPNLNIAYNAEDGLMAGIGFTRKTFGFRKEPYATYQKINTLYAFSSGAYQVHYQGEFNEVIGKNDLVADGQLFKPVLNNFFGLGNNTKYGSENVTYYRVRYNFAAAELLLRKRVGGILSFSAGPQMYYYWNRLHDNEDKILSAPTLVGLDSLRVYQEKAYGGGKAVLRLNNLNSELFPTRGILWNTSFSALAGLNKNSHPLTTLTSDLTLYSSLRDPARFVTILKMGGGRIFSKNYEYFQALNLGGNNFLRGFRKNRFSGSSLAYGSLSLLVKLFDSKSYLLPGSAGVIAFDDVGRVWTENEKSGNWHNSVGAGLYFSPFNMVIISATLGVSPEETLFNLSIGTKFNLTF